MTAWEAVLLGMVQGAFMFMPVSSTSHLVVVQHWLIARGSAIPSPDSPEMILFDLVVHVGTLVSVVVVFRSSLGKFVHRLAADLGRGEPGVGTADPSGGRLHLRLALLGLLTVGVTGVLGLTMKSTFEQIFGHPLAVAGMLVVTGVLLWATDILPRRRVGLRQIGPGIAALVGAAQGLALMPGLSRSGTTIAFALFAGVKRRWAAEYSFFVAIPTIVLAWGVQALEVEGMPDPGAVGLLSLYIGFVVAALVGIVALRLVLRLLYRARFRYFAYYVWLVAGAVALATLGGWI